MEYPDEGGRLERARRGLRERVLREGGSVWLKHHRPSAGDGRWEDAVSETASAGGEVQLGAFPGFRIHGRAALR